MRRGNLNVISTFALSLKPGTDPRRLRRTAAPLDAPGRYERRSSNIWTWGSHPWSE